MLRKPHKQKYPGSQSAENHKNIFDCDKTYVLSHSLTDVDDQTLQKELTRLGYNVTRQRENTTAEIVKIG